MLKMQENGHYSCDCEEFDGQDKLEGIGGKDKSLRLGEETQDIGFKFSELIPEIILPESVEVEK